ncbi:hypothetical protein [Microbulbifer halophilus]|uniref:hypothetical protein n=1 Tax=Microbulbifer halophilus TaxID=453963 RepID=UPI003615581E
MLRNPFRAGNLRRVAAIREDLNPCSQRADIFRRGRRHQRVFFAEQVQRRHGRFGQHAAVVEPAETIEGIQPLAPISPDASFSVVSAQSAWRCRRAACRPQNFSRVVSGSALMD